MAGNVVNIIHNLYLERKENENDGRFQNETE